MSIQEQIRTALLAEIARQMEGNKFKVNVEELPDAKKYTITIMRPVEDRPTNL